MFKFYVALLAVFVMVSSSLNARKCEVAQLSPLLQSHLLRSPIGDNLHIPVYDFVLRELREHENIPSAEIENIRKEEQQPIPGNKPYTATVIESSFSHLLSTLCKGTPGCLSIGIYQKEGLLIGHGSLKDDLPSSAFLAHQPLNSLGIQRVSCQKKTCEYVITWAIYLLHSGKEKYVETLSLTPQQGQLLGFVRSFKKINQ